MTACTALLAGQVHAQWNGGVNNVEGTDSFGSLSISGGTNTIFGLESYAPPAPSLTVGSLTFTGAGTPNLTINSDPSVPGTLNLNGTLTFDGSVGASITSGLSATVPGTINLNGSTRTFAIGNGSNTTDMLISARIANGTGAAGILKTGVGTLELTGRNTYTNGTTVSGGTLLANTTGVGNSSTGSGAVTVASNATLGGIGRIENTAGVITLNSGAFLSPGNNAIGKLTTGDQTWDAGSNYIWELNAPDASSPEVNAGVKWDLVDLGSTTLKINASGVDAANKVTIQVVQGAQTFPHGTLVPGQWFTIARAGTILDATNVPITDTAALAALFDLPTTPYGEVFEIRLDGSSGDYNIQVSVTPEPGSVGLLACGAIGLLSRWRRRRIQSA